jgi:hypothetical protein
MLNEAVDQILKSRADDLERQKRRSSRRIHLRQLDGWLHQIEDMLEEEKRTVPDALVREIATFLRREAPSLHRELVRNRERDAARVLDVLFDAQDSVRSR